MLRLRRSLKLFGVAWLACGAWLGCNAILGNESAEFDPNAALSDGATADGTSTTDGSNDGTSSTDGTTNVDGDVDADVDAGFDAGPCENIATNPFHCGACNHSCAGGGCVDGGCLPVVIAQDVAGPFALAIDSTHVYWINDRTGTLWSVPKVGGTKNKLYEGSDASFPSVALAPHGGSVYFGSSAELDAGILKCAAPACAGGPSVVVANVDAPSSIFVTAGGDMYFTVGSNNGGVRRCPLPCAVGTDSVGATEQFASNVVVGPDDVVYWSALPGRLRRATPIGNSYLLDTPVTTAVAVDAINPVGPDIYYIDETRGPTVVTPDGGGAPRRLRNSATESRHLVVQGSLIYVTEPDTNIVYACDRDGGCDDGGLITVARQQVGPKGIAIDPQFIFWANEGNSGIGGQIMRLAR